MAVQTKDSTPTLSSALRDAVKNYGEAWGGIVSGAGGSGLIVGLYNTFNPVFETIKGVFQSGDSILIPGEPTLHFSGIGWDFVTQHINRVYFYFGKPQDPSAVFSLAPGSSLTFDNIRVSMSLLQDSAFRIYSENASVIAAKARIAVEVLPSYSLAVAMAGLSVVVIGAALIGLSRHMKASERESSYQQEHKNTA